MESTKQARLLELFFRGLRGEELSVSGIAREYGVSSKSISRDINDLKAFFADHRELVGNTELVYSYQSRSYRLDFDEFLSSSEVFALVEVFLGARAFSKMESLNMVEKLKQLTTPVDRGKIERMIQKELYHYKEVHHDCDSVQEILWQLAKCIEERREITVYYHKATREYVERRIQPISLLFTEYYFYLIAFISGTDDHAPIYYRVDRISNIVEHRSIFTVPEGAEFDEGRFRAENQFMFPGKRMTIQFEYSGPSIQAVLDRLPTAKILQKNGQTYLVEATVYGGEGIKMYLLSQGAWVKAVGPDQFVSEMVTEIEKLLGKYKMLEDKT